MNPNSFDIPEYPLPTLAPSGDDPAPVEPVSCTRAQFLDRLIIIGTDDAVEQMLAAKRAAAVTPAEVIEAKRMANWYANALTFDSDSPMLLAAAAELGMTPEAVRQLIIEAQAGSAA